ncbi:MAG: CPBP family intramembrane metalloprotease [Holophagales bacterium]|jgi:membrane protease YdiL (CAAX protease family)|nr:CPBP family intramembrane metalloprotease [Holophagales bacterium]
MNHHLLSISRHKNLIQTLVLLALLLERFLYPVVPEYINLIVAYALSYIFFLTISPENRHLYNLTIPSKKAIFISSAIGVLWCVTNVAYHVYCGAVLFQQFYLYLLLLFIVFPIQLVVQFFRFALIEEILFRGFLWGRLRKFKLSELSILFFTTIFFWGAYYYHFDRPETWIAILIGGLLYGIVAWKTKSLFLSAIVHGCWKSVFVFLDKYK